MHGLPGRLAAEVEHRQPRPGRALALRGMRGEEGCRVKAGYYRPDSLVSRAVDLLRPHADLTEDATTRLLLTLCETKRQARDLRYDMTRRGLLVTSRTTKLTDRARQARARE